MTFTLDIETSFKVTADRLTKGTWKRIYDPEMGFSYNSAMTLALDLETLFKVTVHPFLRHSMGEV